MRAAIVLSALVLAACNPGGPGQSADSGGVFPNLTQTPYRIEANITHDVGTMPVVMMRDGARQRVEMTSPAGPVTMIITDTGEGYVISNAAGQTMAMRVSASDQFKDPAEDWSGDVAASARRTGTCSAAGENGSEWTREDGGETHVICVTDDGIILRSAVAGSTSFEVTSVQRGPQSADLFTLPAGVQVMDLNNLGAQMQQQIERAQREAGQ